MTLHWKDDPKTLKQICLVDQAFASDIQAGFNDSNYDWCFIIERAYQLDILEWIWERMTEKFETKEEILKWKYREKIEAKSENVFKAKNAVKPPEEGEEDPEEKEYMGGLIKIKISMKENFTSSFLKLPGCIPIDCGLLTKADMPYNKMWKIYLEAKKAHPHQPQEICMKEVASIACVSLFDTHYRVNGMKVRNLLGACTIKQDMVISTRVCENIEKVKDSGAYVFPPKKGIETRRPIEFSFNNHIVQAWCIRHDNQMEKKGLYLAILEDLFNKRLELKARLAILGKKKQHLGKMISLAKERGKRIPESLNLEYSSICFDYNYWNSKQKALKIYMDTFYRKAGNSLSPIVLRELACETTTAGKYNLNLVAEFVSKKGFGIKYGDTDSLYLTCSDRIKSGTSYLKMAYKEVLFPVCFTGKKKYFEIGHEDVVNFKPKNLFIKVIDTVKQGKSQLFKFIGERIMRKAMDINNTCSIQKIVEDILREAQNKEWDYNKFIVIGTWKPKKKNLCNNCFMGRMKERNKRIPDPGKRFSYIVIKGPPLYNEQDRKIPHRACFINEDDSFLPPPSDKIMQIKDSDEKEKQINVYSQNEAKKWLKKYIKGLQ
ncbi:hypothetical protein C2G38_2219571 [Gigaspora rosea]|uniref:DNA-directed DNA polymerase n=1 Tax=Gigaspora rosea TaxID=44941 RepID=A0A397U8T7_9GLOM|nr:hypothetical protein C2G38_2219571 [Gigaspora rosea]